MVLKFVGATLLTYFFSRLTQTLPLLVNLLARIGTSHILSLLSIFLFLVLLHHPLGIFEPRKLVIYPPSQFFWLCFDLLTQYRPKAEKAPG